MKNLLLIFTASFLSLKATYADSNNNGVLDLWEEYYWFDDWYIPLESYYQIEEESVSLELDATPQYLMCDLCYLDETLMINEDFDGDGKLDVAEDLNQNGILDSSEDVDGDGFLDIDEDIDNDNILDINTEIFISQRDSNVYHRNGLSNSEILDFDISNYTSVNEINDGVYNAGEAFIQVPNGIYDLGEEFTDAGNLQYDEGEPFVDSNGDGVWQPGEFFTDTLNGVWDEGEDFVDVGGFFPENCIDFNGNGNLDPGECEYLEPPWEPILPPIMPPYQEFSYQWYYPMPDNPKGFPIPEHLGGTDSSYEITAIEANEGIWRVEVTEHNPDNWFILYDNAELVFDLNRYTDILEGNEVSRDWISGIGWSITKSHSFEIKVVKDSDNDGFLDYAETKTGNYVSPEDTGSDPLSSDTSGDGLKDGPVVNAGFNPNVDYSPLFDLDGNDYTISRISDLRAGSVTIQVVDGEANINMDIESSTDLENWEIDSAITVPMPIEEGEATKFFRFKMAE